MRSCLLFGLTLLLSIPCSAEERRVLLVSIDGLSWDTFRAERARLPHLDALARAGVAGPARTVFEGYGERALVCIDGELTHSVRKSPRFHGDDESVSDALPITDAERALAERALAVAPGDDRLYGRVDVAPGPDGAPVIMELELVEPSLFLLQHPPALRRLVAAIARRASAA